jgi:hypothetical protein
VYPNENYEMSAIDALTRFLNFTKLLYQDKISGFVRILSTSICNHDITFVNMQGTLKHIGN